MIEDSVFNSYVDYRTEYKTPQELPAWGVLNIQLDQKKIEKEEQERTQAIREQIKKGILKMPAQIKTVTIKTGDIGRVIVNPAIVTKIRNIDLFEPCVCGSGQLLKDCHLREVLSKK